MPTSASTYISLRGKALILLLAHIFPHLLFYTFFLKDKQYSAMFVKGRRLMGTSHLHASNVPRLVSGKKAPMKRREVHWWWCQGGWSSYFGPDLKDDGPFKIPCCREHPNHWCSVRLTLESSTLSLLNPFSFHGLISSLLLSCFSPRPACAPLCCS